MESMTKQSRSRPGFEVTYLIGSLRDLFDWQESDKSLGYETAWQLAPIGAGLYWVACYSKLGNCNQGKTS